MWNYSFYTINITIILLVNIYFSNSWECGGRMKSSGPLNKRIKSKMPKRSLATDNRINNLSRNIRSFHQEMHYKASL